MFELLGSVSGAAGLVTLGTFFWYLSRGSRMDRQAKRDRILESRLREETGNYSENDDLFADIIFKVRAEPTLSLGIEKLSDEEIDLIVDWANAAAEASDRTQSKSVRPKAPSTYNFLSSHLPEELKDHEEELKQFLQDGLVDQPPKKRTWFKITEHFDLAVFIGKARLFRFSKTWRRTIR